MHDPLYSAETRVAFKGQIFSAPMDWAAVQQQLRLMDEGQIVVALPVTGAILAARATMRGVKPRETTRRRRECFGSSMLIIEPKNSRKT